MTIFQGTAVIEKDFEVHAESEADARLEIIDLAEAEYPEADIYLVKAVEEIG